MLKYEENPKTISLPPGQVIAFDYGTFSMGVAVGQTITGTANPLPSLTLTHSTIPWNKINTILQEWCPVAWVVGIPYNMDGTEQWITEAAREFAQALLQKTHRNVYGIDERLTTREARQILFDQQGYRALQKKKVDGMAAKLILERFLSLLQF